MMSVALVISKTYHVISLGKFYDTNRIVFFFKQWLSKQNKKYIILQLSYLHKGISYTRKMTSLYMYWIRAQGSYYLASLIIIT